MKRPARRGLPVDPLDLLDPHEELEALGPTGMPADVQRAFAQLEFIDGTAEPLEVIRKFLEHRILLPQAERRLKLTKRPSNDEVRREWSATLEECNNSVESAAHLMAQRREVAPRTVHKWRKRAGIT